MGATVTNTKTTWISAESSVRRWYLIDAKDQVLGRLSTRIATILMGKTKPSYTPSVDGGDFVIIINAGKIRLTGNKLETKALFHHSSHPGGAKVVTWKKLYQSNPERLLSSSVKKMLPKNKLASRQILRLKIYRNDSHPHSVQRPEKLI